MLVGDTTALAVADVAELGDQISLELKGKAEPTLARLVTGFRSEPSREQAMGALKRTDCRTRSGAVRPADAASSARELAVSSVG